MELKNQVVLKFNPSFDPSLLQLRETCYSSFPLLCCVIVTDRRLYVRTPFRCSLLRHENCNSFLSSAPLYLPRLRGNALSKMAMFPRSTFPSVYMMVCGLGGEWIKASTSGKNNTKQKQKRMQSDSKMRDESGD